MPDPLGPAPADASPRGTLADVHAAIDLWTAAAELYCLATLRLALACQGYAAGPHGAQDRAPAATGAVLH